MKILFLYPNAEGYQRIPLGAALLMTILSDKGHRVSLFDTTFVRGHSIDNQIREKAGLVKKTKGVDVRDLKTDEQIDIELLAHLREFSPDLIAVSLVEDNYVYADHVLARIKQCAPRIPVVAGGSLPTVAPQVVIQNPSIDFVLQGEGEQSLPALCAYLEGEGAITGVPNLWYVKDGVVHQNPLCSFVDMDSLPTLNLDQWDERHFHKPYDGKVYRAGFFEIGRGCMSVCSYCINHSCRYQLRTAGKYHRKKTIAHLIDEVSVLKDRYRYEMIFFTDDDFLHMSPQDLDWFESAWNTRIQLPYWINTRPERISQESVRRLLNTGCCGVGIGIESGDEWVRKNILKRSVSNERLKDAFKLLKESRIRTTANNMIGFPGEFEEHIYKTIELVRAIEPDSCDVSYVAPYIGTDIHRVSRELGYIDVHERAGFEGMAKNISIRRGPVIRLPQISNERLEEIFYNFMNYVDGSASFWGSCKSVAMNSDRQKQIVCKVVAAMKTHSGYFTLADGAVTVASEVRQ